MKLTRSEIWLILLVLLLLLHHIDQYLRIDHSGWPFLLSVSPFTIGLLAYPVAACVALTRSQPRFRATAVGGIVLFTLLTLLFFETPLDTFHTWTYGSRVPGHIGEENRLGFNSKAFGISSLILAVVLPIVALFTGSLFLKEARRASIRD